MIPDSKVLTLVMGLFGLCVGSFLNVVIYRLPIMIKNETGEEPATLLTQSLALDSKINLCIPGSFCPLCAKRIPYRFNIPILGFLLLKGKSRCCDQKISPKYLLVELATALLFIALSVYFGYTLKLLAGALFSSAAIALFFIDIDEQLLPDHITLPFLWLGLFFNIFAIFTDLTSALLGCILGYLFFYIIAELFKLVRKVEGVGRGDFKLFAMLGAWFGWQLLPTIALIASCSGLIYAGFRILIKKMNYNTPIPFGPFLIIAGFIILFWNYSSNIFPSFIPP